MATTNKKRVRTKSTMTAGRPRSYSDLYKNDNVVPATQPGVATPAKPATSRRYMAPKSPEVTDWKSEYLYVMKDLRLLGIVSVSLIAIIIVAGFFVN
ncbi:MAG: hypothetical protein NT075_32895 [Chloroflexi bacterium]|nr:hypothetical protein [Chloroflexota bacterium]